MSINDIIITVLIILTGFNCYYLFYFKSRSKEIGKLEEKDNYYKLDAKIELQKYLALGLIAIASSFGYSKFTDISDKFDEFEQLRSKYKQLNEDYTQLQIVSKDLQANIVKFQQYNNEIEKEFIKQNQKIANATRKIPEANIRDLTKQLIDINLRNLREAGTSVHIVNDPDTIAINNEIKKSISMLKNVGYSDNEIKEIIRVIKMKYNWYK